MTTNQPPPYPGDQPEGSSSTSGLPSYGSTPPPGAGGPILPPPPGAPGGYQPPGNNKKALWSMILGIVGLLCCSIFTGIPALILGLIGRKEIASSQGTQTGGGMALAGIILGIVSIVFSIIYVILLATGAITYDFSASSTSS